MANISSIAQARQKSEEEWMDLLAKMAGKHRSVVDTDLREFTRPYLNSAGKLGTIARRIHNFCAGVDSCIPDWASPMDEGHSDEVYDLIASMGRYGLAVMDGRDRKPYSKEMRLAAKKLTSHYKGCPPSRVTTG